MAGGPWPFNIVGSWARARPGPGWGTSDEQAPGLDRDAADRDHDDGGGWLTG